MQDRRVIPLCRDQLPQAVMRLGRAGTAVLGQWCEHANLRAGDALSPLSQEYRHLPLVSNGHRREHSKGASVTAGRRMRKAHRSQELFANLAAEGGFRDMIRHGTVLPYGLF